MIDDPVEAARAVRNAVHLAARARVADCAHLVLLLSGGLDSAIVASSLKSADTEVIGLNLTRAVRDMTTARAAKRYQ